MKQTTLFIFCLLAMVLGVESAASQVTRADYERADTILKCSNRVYSPAIHPEWIDSSHYFWYKNHEKEGVERSNVLQIRKDWRFSSLKNRKGWPSPC